MNGLDFRVALYLCGLGLLMSGCFGDDNVTYSEYHFDIPVEISPTGNLYHIGDTVTVSSRISHPLYDEESMEYISAGETFRFPIIHSMNQYDSMVYYEVNENFEIIPVIGTSGTLTSGSSSAVPWWYHINTSTAERDLEFQFIPLAEGVYVFYLFYVSTDYDDGFLENGDDWKSERARLTFNINEREGLGYDLIKDIPYPDIPSKESFESHAVYAFRVVE